jgi:hypothetical protein
MTPTLAQLDARDLTHLVLMCRNEAGTTHLLEDMLGPCRCRPCSSGRAKFYNALRHSYGWSVRAIAEFTGRSVSAVHSAVYHGKEASL